MRQAVFSPEQMLKEKENLDFILQMMIMLNYRGTLTDEECVKKAFQGGTDEGRI